jgi:hypothetical protein
MARIAKEGAAVPAVVGGLGGHGGPQLAYEKFRSKARISTPGASTNPLQLLDALLPVSV